MLNFAICDDNLVILDKLSKILDSIFLKHNYDAKISFTAANPSDVLDAVSNTSIDVLLLDVNLKSDKNGLDIASEVRSQNKDIYLIFTTSHLEYAMVAYKYKTFDYLAKPISYERLEDTIHRLFEDVHGTPKKYIKIDQKNTVILDNDIQYIRRDGMKLIYHTQSSNYDTYSSFNKMSDKLPQYFVRCHKSFIANINNLKNVDWVTSTVTFIDGSSCDIGPKYKKSFSEVLKENGII